MSVCRSFASLPRRWKSLPTRQIPPHGALPFLFIMFCAWSWTVKREPARTACASLANFCAVSTGFSWFVGLITPILFLLDARAARQAGGRLVFSLIGLL